ncbi:MAG: molybdopterin biosynthesis protein, partial [Paracoccaceae bacterium]
MIFAEVTLEEAEGAILAHSISCSGERLKKGTVLRVEHLLSLRAAGTERITVARLTADDIDENAAAEILADALLDHEWQG